MSNSHKPVRREQRTRRIAIIVVAAMVGAVAIPAIGYLVMALSA